MTQAFYTLTESQWAFMASRGWKEGRARETKNDRNTTLLLYVIEHLGPPGGQNPEQRERTRMLTVIAEDLIGQGADVNAMDYFGHSVLGEAGEHGKRLITLLLAAGADPNQREHWHPNNTVAMTCLNNHIDGLKNRPPAPTGLIAIIGRGLGHLNGGGKARTLEDEVLDMALQLVAAGADPNTPNNEGKKLGDFLMPPVDLVVEAAKRTADHLDGILPKAMTGAPSAAGRRL
jgi:ankyrin repeat protein